MPTAGFLFLLLGMEACPQTSLEKFVGSQNIVRFTTLLMTETYATRRKIMIRTIVFALLGLALASTAQAMPISRAYQPDNMITQARMGCGVGMVMVNVPAGPEPACAKSTERTAGAYDILGAFAFISGRSVRPFRVYRCPACHHEMRITIWGLPTRRSETIQSARRCRFAAGRSTIVVLR